MEKKPVIKRYLLLSVTLTYFLCSCVFKDKTNEAKDSMNIEENRIVAVLDSQVAQWNNGSIKGFMSYYSNGEGMRFITKNGIKKSKDQVENSYVKSFPNREAMGELRFDLIEVEPVGGEMAGVRGKWNVFREKDSISGLFSLILVPEAGSWRVLLDHTW